MVRPPLIAVQPPSALAVRKAHNNLGVAHLRVDAWQAAAESAWLDSRSPQRRVAREHRAGQKAPEDG